MNVAHIITRLIIGGAQENTILTCRGLVERGHRVTLIAGPETGAEGSLWEQAKASGCDLVRLDPLRRAIHPVHDLRAFHRLEELLRDMRTDVVHTHSSKAGIIGRTAAAKAGVPVVVHTIHGMSFNRTQSAVAQAVYRALERYAARYTTGFIAVADSMIDQAVAAGLGARHRFVTIRSGLDTGLFAPRAERRREHRARWGVSDADVVVGTIARLFANKGYDEIIAAMPLIAARSPAVRFVWIGDGRDRGAYERMVERIGLRECVTLLGLLNPAEVAEAINGFDIILHASRWEGLPRAIVQGLLTEVPAVSFDNDGAPEVVIDGQTGRLVPYGDIQALADAVSDLACDAPLRRKLGARGRDVCLRDFDWHVMVDRIEEYYQQLRRQDAKA